MQLADAVDSPAGHKLSYQQYVGDIPVHKGRLSVYVTYQGRVYRIANDLRPDAIRSAEISVDQIAIELSDAVQVAVDAVKGTDRLRREPEANLVIVSEEGTSRLAWQVSVLLTRPSQSWEVLVDSQSGQVLEMVPVLMTGVKR